MGKKSNATCPDRMKQTITIDETSVNKNVGDLPVKSERNFWLIRVEMMSSDTSDSFHMRIIIMKHFFIQLHSVGHVIQLLHTIKKTKQDSWNVLQCFRNILITFYRLAFSPKPCRCSLYYVSYSYTAYYLASSVSWQKKPKPVLRLATRTGKKALSCPLGITAVSLKKNYPI